MSYDLHCHSSCSDGELSPDELLSMAQLAGVSALSITDHDTVDAYKTPSMCADNAAIRLIPGVEFSTQWRGIGIHILGLNIDPGAAAIEAGVQFQKQARENRANIIAQKLERLGVMTPYEGALSYAGEAPIGRPHFAKYLVDTGFCKDLRQAFRKYLGAGKVGDVKQEWASMCQVISWIRGGSGVAVLAHPHHYKMTRTKLLKLIDEFVRLGGQGIEVLSGQQKENVATYLSDIAERSGLVASMGSDFHRPGQHGARLGMHKALPANCRPVWELF